MIALIESKLLAVFLAANLPQGSIAFREEAIEQLAALPRVVCLDQGEPATPYINEPTRRLDGDDGPGMRVKLFPREVQYNILLIAENHAACDKLYQTLLTALGPGWVGEETEGTGEAAVVQKNWIEVAFMGRKSVYANEPQKRWHAFNADVRFIGGLYKDEAHETYTLAGETPPGAFGGG